MSLFICPIHGLHVGPECCEQPQTYWGGEFADEPDDSESQPEEPKDAP